MAFHAVFTYIYWSLLLIEGFFIDFFVYSDAVLLSPLSLYWSLVKMLVLICLTNRMLSEKHIAEKVVYTSPYFGPGVLDNIFQNSRNRLNFVYELVRIAMLNPLWGESLLTLAEQQPKFACVVCGVGTSTEP